MCTSRILYNKFISLCWGGRSRANLDLNASVFDPRTPSFCSSQRPPLTAVSEGEDFQMGPSDSVTCLSIHNTRCPCGGTHDPHVASPPGRPHPHTSCLHSVPSGMQDLLGGGGGGAGLTRSEPAPTPFTTRASEAASTKAPGRNNRGPGLASELDTCERLPGKLRDGVALRHPHTSLGDPRRRPPPYDAGAGPRSHFFSDSASSLAPGPDSWPCTIFLKSSMPSSAFSPDTSMNVWPNKRMARCRLVRS